MHAHARACVFRTWCSRKSLSAATSCCVTDMRMSVALSLTASGDTLRMRVAISNSPSCTRRLKSCWRCCGCRWRASEQNSCKNAIRSPHSASPGVWRSRRRNSSGRKRGSDCSAVTTCGVGMLFAMLVMLRKRDESDCVRACERKRTAGQQQRA
eukprot:25607-Chlamydomonas_euryale.AAC.3